MSTKPKPIRKENDENKFKSGVETITKKLTYRKSLHTAVFRPLLDLFVTSIQGGRG
jgi:hypothetical protein